MVLSISEQISKNSCIKSFSIWKVKIRRILERRAAKCNGKASLVGLSDETRRDLASSNEFPRWALQSPVYDDGLGSGASVR
jgi:hypothetical protein